MKGLILIYGAAPNSNCTFIGWLIEDNQREYALKVKYNRGQKFPL